MVGRFRPDAVPSTGRSSQYLKELEHFIGKTETPSRKRRPPASDDCDRRSMMPAREKGEFYKKDRKVLRFFCKYKDSRLQGDKRDYILYYYLLNDTVEIKEVGSLHMTGRTLRPGDGVRAVLGFCYLCPIYMCGSTCRISSRHLFFVPYFQF